MDATELRLALSSELVFIHWECIELAGIEESKPWHGVASNEPFAVALIAEPVRQGRSKKCTSHTFFCSDGPRYIQGA